MSGCVLGLSLCVCVRSCKYKPVCACACVSIFALRQHFCISAYAASADLSFCTSCMCVYVFCCMCVGVCVTKPLTSNKDPACQIRLLEQSVVTPLTCCLRKLMLTVMDGANETSKCERCLQKRICAFVGVRETFA